MQTRRGYRRASRNYHRGLATALEGYSERFLSRATLPSGLILNSLMLHERNGARWVGLPAREWTNTEGVKQFAKLVEFADRRTADKFRDSVLDALDQHLELLA